MKKIFILSIITLTLFSCQSTFYQIMSTTSNNVHDDGDKMIYENEDCRITYNLWAEYGNSGFVFYNKTDQNIYIDLCETFYILNGQAHNYFKNRTFKTGSTKSLSSAISSSNAIGLSSALGGSLTDGSSKIETLDLISMTTQTQFEKGVKNEILSSVEIKEEAIICIPPYCYKVINEYPVINELFRQCGYLLFPTDKKVTTLEFTIATSPIRFTNRITYYIGNESSINNVIENDFYVSAITNYTKNKAINKQTIKTDCMGKKLDIPKIIHVFTDSGANKFYIKYVGDSQKNTY